MDTCKGAFAAGSRENSSAAPPVTEEKPVDHAFRARRGTSVQLRPPFTLLYARAVGDSARNRATGAVGCPAPIANKTKRANGCIM